MNTVEERALDLKALEEVFLPYHLEKEVKRREEALLLFDACDYSRLNNNYVHYLIGKRVEVEVTDTTLNGALSQLHEIQEKLPSNTTYAELGWTDPDNGDGHLFVTWVEYNIEPATHCLALAKNWASSSAWKMKYQPNGIDGKAAIELYKQLVTPKNTRNL